MKTAFEILKNKMPDSIIIGGGKTYRESEIVEAMEEYARQFGITKGLKIVAVERQKHLETGKTPKRDYELYHRDELKNAALFLLTGMSGYYPRTWDMQYQWVFGRKQGVEALKDAAALLIAEIDRLDFIDALPF